ncbi:MAG TPA: nucleotide pyrophosphohydrolase [Anaeromyxobacter sp.]|nr:nucleotide pyrophosphohydrolase [Anaeromyxobacter sp.]
MGDLERVLGQLRQFTAERDWARFHDPKNLAMLLASEAGELVALLRWVANAEADAFVRAEEHRPSVEAEAADVAIALLLFCDRAGIDLARAIEAKIAANAAKYPVALSRGHARTPGR